ncbi:uncharacterized protein LOC106178424 isoform X2 [Lingula anatina]|uniref:Uncharacterized protein LOC106178424 isoform X2 n=1 Tax=Lingula anatina TaxID=7574 RepID=A0A1S3K453_LINAN|nr:uncharacterized protein LOC106178424 isoform X2 [Lingula anatina]|eukprot:XP_013417036.2 uncharacterized protein LOC106178424 isoform X2 [Lingula anatina]
MKETTRGSAAATPSLGSGGNRRGKDGAPQDGIPKLGSTKLPNGKVDAGGGVATSAEVQSNHTGELGNNTATTATAAAMTAKDQQLSAEPVGNVHQEENDRLRRGGMSPNQNISTTTSNASNQADQRVKVKQVQNPTVVLLREENHENLQRSSSSEVGQSPAKSVSSPSLSSAAEHDSKLPRFATTSGLRGSMRRNVGFASLRRDTTSPSKDGCQEVKRSGQGSVVTTTSADLCDGNLSTVTSTSTMSNNMDSPLCGRSDVVSTSSSARSSSSTSEASSGRSSTDQCRSTKLKYMSGSCSSSQLSLNSVSSEDYEGQGRRGTDSELDVAPKQYRDLRHFSGLRRNSAPPETLSDDLQQFCKKLSSEVDGSYTNAAIYANASSNDTALPHTASPVNQDTSASSQTQPTSPSLKSGLSSPRYSLIGRSTFPRSYRSASLPCIEESVILKQWEEMKGKGSEKSSSVDTLNEVSRRLSREQMTTAMFQTEDEDEVFTQGDDILLRESPPSTKERPKSDYLSNWTNDIWEENGPRRCTEKPRPKSDDLGGISLVSQAMKLYGGEKAEDVFEEGMRTPPLFTTSEKKKSMQEMVRPGLKSRRMSTPHPIKNRVERSPPKSRHNKRPQLVRSLSNPETIHHAGKRRKAIFAQGMAISTEAGEIALALSRTSTYSNSSNDSDTDSSSDDELHTSFRGRSSSDHSTHPALHTMEEIFEDESPIYAEALWDHVTMDEEELRFQAGDVIEVTDMSDKDWWWGIIGEREGWFPAAFVRLRANQEDTAEEYVEKMKDGNLDTRTTRRHCSFSFLSKDQARTNVVNEILSAEREYVKHLEDVIEGYVKQARKRPEMFSEERIRLIFSNMEEIYEFTSEFLEELETCYNETMPHLSEIGQCFINHSKGFEIYSDYCNNHPAACEELKEVQKNKKYKHFFEACRLLQDMIQIPLEGFLLTPVQKICKYPLQLAELLKYTRPEHRDYDTVQEALETMRKIAVLINERKRKMESVEKIAAWQRSVEDWEGPHLLETSSELIYSAEVCKVNSTGWTQDRTLFLFDHLLIYCKKDMLKRDSYSFRGRIDMDHCNVIQIEDGKDSQFNASVKNALKLHDASIDKWYLICSKTPEDRDRWLQAFREERRRVREDQENNFVVPERMKKAAINSKHHSKQHSKRSYPEKPLEKGISRKVSRMPYPYHIEVLNSVPSHITLPRGISSHDTVSNKKRNWFPFLKGKR